MADKWEGSREWRRAAAKESPSAERKAGLMAHSEVEVLAYQKALQ